MSDRPFDHWAFGRSISQPDAVGSNPCSVSQRGTPRLRGDHHPRITSRLTTRGPGNVSRQRSAARERVSVVAQQPTSWTLQRRPGPALTGRGSRLHAIAVATVHNPSARVRHRREATIEEILDHAQAIVAEQGAGGLTVTEIARRLGVRAPSIYKYFPSLHSIYDALFARGNARVAAFIQDAARGATPGLERTLVSSRAMVEWSMREPALAALMYWRPIPGFEPSAESFEPSRGLWRLWREDLTTAVENGELSASADSDQAMRMLTVLISGICSQQMANQPHAPYEEGIFSRLTDSALEMFVHHHQPARTPEKEAR